MNDKIGGERRSVASAPILRDADRVWAALRHTSGRGGRLTP